jgi:glycosyltransferase involved in cell wall biosynthesis
MEKNVRDYVTVLIPTFNEINGMKWFMPRLKREWYDELIVADAGSTDGTLEYCRENGYPVFVQSGKGLPNAYEEAYGMLKSEGIVVTLSPDGNSLPELIPLLTAKIREGYDMAIASRYLGDAKSEDDDAMTAFGNWMFTRLINFLFGGHYTDTLVAIRAYRKEAIDRMRLRDIIRTSWLSKRCSLMNSWETGSSIRAAKLKLKVAEIPGDEPKRIGGERKMTVVKNGLGTLFQVLQEKVIGQRFID